MQSTSNIFYNTCKFYSNSIRGGLEENETKNKNKKNFPNLKMKKQCIFLYEKNNELNGLCTLHC